MTTLRRGLLALAVSVGMAAGALPAAAEGLDKGPGAADFPEAWQGLYGGVHLGHGDIGFDDGLLGGVQIGRNWQRGNIVYGLEGDVSFSDIDFVDWVATARGRLGYLITPGLLLYGTAGVGFIDFGDTETDFVYGLGVETWLTHTTTVRLEYLGFSDVDLDVIRVGVNMKLNW